MKRCLFISAIVYAIAVTAHAGLLVDWYAGSGFYVDPYTTDVSSIMQGGSPASVLAQLIYAPSTSYSSATPGGGVDGGFTILDTYTVTEAGDSEWGNFGSQSYSNTVFTAGYVYGRIFDSLNPAADAYYYNGDFLALADKDLGPPRDTPQLYDLNQDLHSGGPGDDLTLQVVPEPGTMALFAFGAVTMAAGYIRRRK